MLGTIRQLNNALPTLFGAMDEILEFQSASQWDKWLAGNYSKSRGIWIRFFKKASDVSSINTSDALDVPLCYGWITGQAKPYDERSWLGKFVPRRPKSIWSKINTKRAETLIRQGRMKSAGLKQVEEAKRDRQVEPSLQPAQHCKIARGFPRSAPEEQRGRGLLQDAKPSQHLLGCIQARERKERRVEEYEDQADDQDVREGREVPLMNLPNLATPVTAKY